MTTITVKEFCAQRGFVQAAKSVRQNENGYPFVTFYTDKKDSEGRTVCENVYFSKNAAKTVAAGSPVDAQLFSNLQIAEVQNEAGELRTKLISNSERVELSDMF